MLNIASRSLLTGMSNRWFGETLTYIILAPGRKWACRDFLPRNQGLAPEAPLRLPQADGLPVTGGVAQAVGRVTRVD
jgi:hypothetical protein